MPTQRGSSFSCDRCGKGGYLNEDEAKAHESTCVLHPPPTRAAAITSTTPAPAAAAAAAVYQYHGAHHGYYTHYPTYQYHPTTHHPYQEPQYPADDPANVAAGNLSSMKKMPLKTIADNADEGEEDEFGGLSGRKLDHTFAERGLQSAKKASTTQSPTQQLRQKLTVDSTNCELRAPTPLLLTPDQCSDGKAEASSFKTFGAGPSGGEVNRSNSTAADTVAPPSSKLAELDAMTCHSIEAFQATADDVAAFDPAVFAKLLGDNASSSISVGQVGFRCSHCFHDSNKDGTKSDLCVVYPSSVGTIPSSLGAMRDRHFPSCVAMPEESRNAFSDAQRKQEEEDAASGRNGNRGENSEPNDEQRRIAFLEFSVDFCRKKGIVNVQPQSSGLVYGSTGAADIATESVAVADNEAEDDNSRAAGLNAAAAVLAMARPNVTPLASKRDREGTAIPHFTGKLQSGEREAQSGEQGAKAVQQGVAETGAPQGQSNATTPTPTDFPFFPDGYGAWICRCKYNVMKCDYLVCVPHLLSYYQ